MRQDLELSDKIAQLFNLSDGQFDPGEHLPIAEQVVREFGRPQPYWFRITDIWEHDTGKRVLKADRESTGYYIVRRTGRLWNASLLGYHPKLRLTHWKDEVFRSDYREVEDVVISYEDNAIRAIGKSVITNSQIEIPFGLRKTLVFNYHAGQTVWVFKNWEM